ncbi:MAG: type II secretion system protein, partial [Candidatus Gracilibacteria bacterium]
MMKRKNVKNRGFTLIELLIAMTIFVMFVGVLMGSYISVIKGQKEANDYRILYSESRRIFEMITEE